MSRELTTTTPLDPKEAYLALTQLSPGLAIAVDTPAERRSYLQHIHQQLNQWFLSGVDTELLLHLRAEIMDAFLIGLWEKQEWGENPPVSLLAVGGYGRKALHPHSDIDITILIADSAQENSLYLDKIQHFMAALWDCKLKMGHSVRSLRNSLEQAEQDITILTSLLENRFLSGDKALSQQLTHSLYALCSVHQFTTQKYAEYQQRYARYGCPPYTLEPDVKESPGGLRDIQLIEWLVNFKHKTIHIEPYLEKIFLPEELKEWETSKAYLNTLRFARHTLSSQPGDQLIFDYQLNLTQLFNIHAADNNKAVSLFMHDYFSHTRRIAQLTLRALRILQAYPIPAISLDLNNPYIILKEGEIRFTGDDDQIKKEPWRLFELFSLFSEEKSAYQLDVHTQRLVEKYSSLIPAGCQHDPQYQTLFMRILRSPKIAETLKLLNAYALLSIYISEFSPVINMMQYDLFHAYPVDQHTLLLVENLSNFIHHPDISLFPLSSEIAKTVIEPEALYLAGLFHDIGKGQGGHHEEIGAQMIVDFAKAHHFKESDIELMQWLVEQHLLLSHTAQHQDMTNPAVIDAFSQKVKDKKTLDYLYLLTIADIYATNPKLWTAWRSSLIDSLYQSAIKVLTSNDTFNPIKDIAEKYAHLIPDNAESSVVNIDPHASNSATEIFIYTQQHDELFFSITSLLDKLQLSILAANIHTIDQHHNLSTYVVVQRGNKPVDNSHDIERVKKRLYEQLMHIEKIKTPELKRLPSRVQALNYPTLVQFDQNIHANDTIMRLFTADRPGLLAHIAHVCLSQRIKILRAQINTLAERAEDIFWIQNAENMPLSQEEQKQLSLKLQQVLG